MMFDGKQNFLIKEHRDGLMTHKFIHQTIVVRKTSVHSNTKQKLMKQQQQKPKRKMSLYKLDKENDGAGMRSTIFLYY